MTKKKLKFKGSTRQKQITFLNAFLLTKFDSFNNKKISHYYIITFLTYLTI